MLLELKIKNFLSFKDEMVLSFVADSKTDLPQNVINFDNNIENINILKSAVIFGSNASGKSNIFEIITIIKVFLVTSFEIDKPILSFKSFKLNNYSKNDPISICMTFILENMRYEYSFSILDEKIYSESLYCFRKGIRKYLFIRNKQKLKVDYEVFDIAGKSVEATNSLRDNALFISTLSTFNGELSKKIRRYFGGMVHVISGLESSGKKGEEYDEYIIDTLKKDQNFKMKLENFIKVADLGIDTVNIKELESNSDHPTIETFHNLFDENYQSIGNVSFDLDVEESEGTRQFVHLLGPIIDTLETGSALFIDEMTSKLHPYVSKFIVSLFNSHIYNKNNAQLIFNTHDTNLLDLDIFRRDQIYFTEKNKRGESQLFSLNEFSQRKDSNIEKKYLMGNFGAVPFIDNSKKLW